MAESKGWLIGQYTGDPHKDAFVTFNGAGSMTAASLCTVAVTGAVLAQFAQGTSSTALYNTADVTQRAAGTVVFKGGASELFSYLIISTGKS
jgi:hypothetical protein